MEGLARAGRGHCSKLRDLKDGSLAAEVVEALNRAMHPSLEDCSIQWYREEKKYLGELFYNQLVSSYILVDKADLPQVTLTFNSK